MVYYQTKFGLTKSQLEKIATAVYNSTEFTLRLSKTNFNKEGYELPLTSIQLNKLNDNGVHDLKFSLSQVNFIQKKVKSGGFLPLAALIPIIATVLGGVGSVAGTVASVVQKGKANSEQERHNRELENQFKSGSGIVKDYNKMAKNGHSKDDIVASLRHKYGAGIVSDFLAKIPVLGNLLTPITKTLGLGLKTKKAKGLYLKAGNGLRL